MLPGEIPLANRVFDLGLHVLLRLAEGIDHDDVGAASDLVVEFPAGIEARRADHAANVNSLFQPLSLDHRVGSRRRGEHDIRMPNALFGRVHGPRLDTEFLSDPGGKSFPALTANRIDLDLFYA